MLTTTPFQPQFGSFDGLKQSNMGKQSVHNHSSESHLVRKSSTPENVDFNDSHGRIYTRKLSHTQTRRFEFILKISSTRKQIICKRFWVVEVMQFACKWKYYLAEWNLPNYGKLCQTHIEFMIASKLGIASKCLIINHNREVIKFMQIYFRDGHGRD